MELEGTDPPEEFTTLMNDFEGSINLFIIVGLLAVRTTPISIRRNVYPLFKPKGSFP